MHFFSKHKRTFSLLILLLFELCSFMSVSIFASKNALAPYDILANELFAYGQYDVTYLEILPPMKNRKGYFKTFQWASYRMNELGSYYPGCITYSKNGKFCGQSINFDSKVFGLLNNGQAALPYGLTLFEGAYKKENFVYDYVIQKDSIKHCFVNENFALSYIDEDELHVLVGKEIEDTNGEKFIVDGIFENKDVDFLFESNDSCILCSSSQVSGLYGEERMVVKLNNKDFYNNYSFFKFLFKYFTQVGTNDSYLQIVFLNNVELQSILKESPIVARSYKYCILLLGVEGMLFIPLCIFVKFSTTCFIFGTSMSIFFYYIISFLTDKINIFSFYYSCTFSTSFLFVFLLIVLFSIYYFILKKSYGDSNEKN